MAAPAEYPVEHPAEHDVTHDVIVVGAGPAGSTVAREIAAHGLKVLLLDRARFPRDKPCGGAVSLRCADLLPFDLSPVVEEVITGVRIRLRGGAEVTHDPDGVLTYMTQRSRLDHFLAERAQEAGVEFRDGQTVRSVARAPAGSYDVATNGEVHRARAVVGADGANGVVAVSLGFERPRGSLVALEANLPCPDGVPERLRGHVALQFGEMPGGYGWLFPKGDHINVGVGGWTPVVGNGLRASLEQLCRSYDIDPGALVSMRGHHLPTRRPGAPLTAGGAALVGDAAGLVDPLSGEGIYHAVASAIALAPAVADYVSGATGSLAGYQRTVERELLPDLVTSRALTDVFHAFPSPFVALLQHSRRSWRATSRILRGELSYDAFVHQFGPLSYALRPLAGLGRRISTRRYGAR